MSLTYGQALQALADRGRFGVRLGLGRTRALLRELGNPERTVRGALVGGTNGKGSVLALADAALRAAGYRTGTTPKPHLVTYRERICIDGRPIAAADFARLVGSSRVADRVARRHGEPSGAGAADGGRLARSPRPALTWLWWRSVWAGGWTTHDGRGVAVITNVDLDHTDRLTRTSR
jgi:folylpolyglutamate synthase/dihydropteroate synthase